MSTKLRYGFSLSEGAQIGLTYLNAGAPGTITVIVSNPGDPVNLQSLTFSVSIGNQNTDLASATGDIVVSYPADWTDDGNFSYTAPSGFMVDGTTQLQFSFAVQINPLPGTTTIGIKETTDSGTAFLTPPYSLLKVPSSFTLANLTATPNEVARGTPVSLTWAATPGQLYTINYPDGPTNFTPTSPLAAWMSPPIQTAQQSYTFTVSASTQVGGQTVTLQLPIVVTVDNPQIVAFIQPTAPYMTPPVTLNWQTSNSDHCQLFTNGILVDGNAPANPGTDGYTVHPTVVATPYKLIAVKGTALSPSQEVDVIYAQWPEAAPVPFNASQMAIAMSPSGSLLYVNTGSNLYSIDSVSFHEVASAEVYDGAGLRTVVSADGNWVYTFFLSENQGHYLTGLYRYQGAGLAFSLALAAGNNSFAVDSDTDPISYLFYDFAILACHDILHIVAQYNFGDTAAAYGAVVNPDSTLVYFLRAADAGIALWRYHIADNTADQVLTGMGGATGVTPWISPDGNTLYVTAPGEHSLQPVALPACTLGAPILIDANGAITRIIANSTGTVLFIAVSYASGGAVYYMDLASQALRKIATSQANAIDIACRPDGSSLFMADGANVRVFNLNVTPTSRVAQRAPG